MADDYQLYVVRSCVPPPYAREWLDENLRHAPLGLWVTDDDGSGVPWGKSMIAFPDGRIQCTYHYGSDQEYEFRWRAKEPWIFEVARLDEDVWYPVPYRVIDTKAPWNKAIHYECDLDDFQDYGFSELMYRGMRFD